MDDLHLRKKYAAQWAKMEKTLDNEFMPLAPGSQMIRVPGFGRVNIAIPTLGLRPEITDTIDCLLAQTYEDIKIFVLIQGAAAEFNRLKAIYPPGEKLELIFEQERIGWVASINKIAQVPGHLFALADDVAMARDAIDILISEMQRIFPDSDGVLCPMLTNTIHKGKRGWAGSFPFIGDKFIERFPERSVICPDYIAYGGDVELPDFACSINKCFEIRDAKLIHFEMRAAAKGDSTSKITRQTGLPDIERYFIRQNEGFLWGENFKLLRGSMPQPFLTVLTRCHPKRPKCLDRNIDCIASQGPGIQHLLLKPDIEPLGTPREKATAVGPLIHYAGPHIRGEWVIQLDDDDILATPDFMKIIKGELSKDPRIDMIIFKCDLGGRILPPKHYWEKRELKIAEIAGPNIMVKKEVYDQASDQWLRPVYESDFHYIKKCFKVAKRVKWLDIIGTKSQGEAPNNVGAGEDKIKFRGR
jgi:hypothetical protein